MNIHRFGVASSVTILPHSPSVAMRQLLAAARSRSGSDNRSGCHSLPSRRFATSRRRCLACKTDEDALLVVEEVAVF